ncbi:hypothetical protein HYN49_13420 [Flavobacterium pallidum]|uniref:Uncharacterized protein n=1 Tax=Flavobacterium pallidum TaxID=2172098 RepID=A0A2S1SKE2_9FLAO|nr:hypothetical protein HYN49_13420 [Flavobacterium pallidum]
MKALSKLYTAVLDNKVVAFGTNLKDFVTEMQSLEPQKTRNYQYYFRAFQKEKIIELKAVDKVYFLQEVYNRE